MYSKPDAVMVNRDCGTALVALRVSIRIPVGSMGLDVGVRADAGVAFVVGVGGSAGSGVEVAGGG